MNLQLPVLFQSWPASPGQPLKIRAQCWFSSDLWVEGRLLTQVQNRLRQRVQERVRELKSHPRQESLAHFLLAPEALREHRLELNLSYRNRNQRVAAMAVSWSQAESRTLVLQPQGLWLDWPMDHSLEELVSEALLALAREQQWEHIEGLAPKHWLGHLSVPTGQANLARPPAPPSLMALLGAEEERSAGEELARVGRRLESRLRQHALPLVGSQDHLQRLLGWLEPEPEGNRSAILLVGPRLCGKTALLYEAIRRSQQSRSKTGSFWWLSPARLISGQSVLGQWETRWLKILRHLRRGNHVLVLDDLLALITAGVSRDSDLNVAQVLLPYLQQKQLRVVAECTPEQLQIVRQRLPELLEPFQLMRLSAGSLEQGLRTALAAARHSEDWQGSRFTLEALLLLGELCDRYLRDSAFPGKAAQMVRQLAARYRGQAIDVSEVLQHFQQRTGLSLSLLDDRVLLDRERVVSELQAQIVAQPEAVQACADAVCLAKARIQERNRPIASYLFIGPTGVGKTECARALSRALFGSRAGEALVRIDLNEYVGDDAVSRLVGSFHRPQGILTEAVRRQPFCVLLLDEVEKAHPQVLQLLLQLLGDGRLTDARGRTTDFSQCLVLLTSNLGAAEADRPLGFRAVDDASLELTYRRAAEQFFTPELFNRIDRVVAFRRLPREAVARLALLEVQKVLRREGLQRRQCLLEVTPEALERLTDLGYHPQLGARALKRAVERHLTGPVAAQLAAMPAHSATLVALREDLEVQVISLESERRPWEQPSVEQLASRLQRWQQELAQQRPEGPIDSDSLSSEVLWHYQREEGLEQLEQRLRRCRLAPPARPRSGGRAEKLPDLQPLDSSQWQLIAGSSDLRADLRALHQQLRQRNPDPQGLQRLLLQLQMRQWHQARPEDEGYTLALSGSAEPVARLKQLYLQNLELLQWQQRGLQLVGPLAATIMQHEEGYHLFLEGDSLQLVALGKRARLVRIYAANGVVDLGASLWSAAGDGVGWMMLASLPEVQD